MRTGISISVTPADLDRLRALVKDRNSPQKHVWRARIVLLTAEAARHERDHARDRQVARPASGAGRSGSWPKASTGCCATRPGPRASPPLDPAVAERVVALTLADPPGETTHWTGRGDGQGGRRQRQLGAAHLARPRPAAASGAAVQAVQRPEVRRQGARRRRALRRSAGPRRGAVRRREEPDPGARPHPAGPADEEGPRRNHDPRLQAPRHDDAVRRARTCWTARSSAAACSATGIRSSSASSTPSSAEVPAGKIVHAIVDNYATHKHPKVVRNGSHAIRAGPSTSPRPRPPGSTPSRASSPS